jgi:glyoxylase-like metal-dependent hydrolase (beta-lactamase superfamily II)
MSQLRPTRVASVALALAACSSGGSPPGTPDATGGDDDVADAPPGTPDAMPLPRAPLAVQFLGVQGWVVRHGDEALLTAPLFTRASVFDVSFGSPVPSDHAAIDAGLAGIELGDVRAIVTGHAHYDHLLDAPRILAEYAPDAVLYANRSARHILAALAPDRDPSCTSPTAMPPLDRDRVVALDDPIASAIDYTGCPDLRPPGAPLEGSWVRVPGSRIRIFPVCSVHPDQFLFIHFGPGSVTEDQCDLPEAAGDWLEGQTISFLIDFLDANDQPAFRIFYHDAPTDEPVGFPPAAVLADKQVDLALLCVGSADSVDAHPQNVLAALQPRFALSGHWENFFQSGGAPQPIPFLDVAAYDSRADTAMTGTADPPLIVDGQPTTARHIRPDPGTEFVVPPSP